MAISNETLYIDVWTTLRNIIVASAPFITNSVTASTSAASIYVAYNDRYPSRPQVIINPIQKTESDYKFGTLTIGGKKTINVVIDCFGDKSLYADQLIQAVDYALTSTSIPEIELVGSTSNGAFESINGGEKLFGQSMTFTYIEE